MTDLMSLLGSDFFPLLFAGMLVNFKIAALALVFGLLLALPLTLLMASGTKVATAITPLIALMRGAPTFVIMFFLLNAIPRDATLFGAPFALSGVMTVAISLLPFVASYIVDNGVESIQLWRQGSHIGALLLIPNITRAFFILVMASSAGAAIGVNEAITVILRQAEHLPTLGGKLGLFGVGILLFGVIRWVGFFVIGKLHQRITTRFSLQNRNSKTNHLPLA